MCADANASHPPQQKVTNKKELAVPSFGTFKTILERVEAMEQAITHYGCFASAVSSSSPVHGNFCPPVLGGGPVGNVVLITGSTGNMGSRILVGLLKDERVKIVYAVNRPSARKSISERHMERFEDSGLDKELLRSSKVVFIETEISEERMGLDGQLYDKIRTSVNVIIHSAWRLNFVAPFSTFEPNIRGTRNLLDLGRASPSFHGPAEKRVKFIFTSSVSATYGWDRTLGPYPEEMVYDPNYAVGSGYGESKYAVERILAKSGLNATSLRIGQCCGGLSNGAWPVFEWFPALVKSSVAMGMLPSADGIVRLIPIDTASGAILDLVFYPKVFPPAMNVIHPAPMAWNYLIKLTSEALVAQKIIRSPLRLVSFSEWVAKLEMLAKTANRLDFKRLPGLKLIGLYKRIADYDVYSRSLDLFDSDAEFDLGGLPHFETFKIRELSPTMKELEPVKYQDVERWVKYWHDASFFDDNEISNRRSRAIDNEYSLGRL